MARFPDDVAAQLLGASKRHCCVCLRWCGQRRQIHHVLPVSAGGEGSFDNGIPVGLDCHAEIESRSNMGRRFSPAELRRHRDEWFRTVEDRPEVLLRAAHVQTETWPREALLAELDINGVAVSGKPEFSGRYDTGTAVRHFDVSLDDRRFLMTLLPDDALDKPVSDMTIVVNWLDELHARER